MFQQGNFVFDDQGNMYINGQKINLKTNNEPNQKTIEELYMGPVIDAEFKTKEEPKEENEPKEELKETVDNEME